MRLTCSFIGVSVASDKFYGLVESVGAKSSNLPGAVRKMGKWFESWSTMAFIVHVPTPGNCMLDMVASHRHMSENFDDWVSDNGFKKFEA